MPTSPRACTARCWWSAPSASPRRPTRSTCSTSSGTCSTSGLRAQHRDDDGAGDAALPAALRHQRGEYANVAVRARRNALANPSRAPEGRRSTVEDVMASPHDHLAAQAVRHLPALAGAAAAVRQQRRAGRKRFSRGRPSSMASRAAPPRSASATAWRRPPMPTSSTSRSPKRRRASASGSPASPIRMKQIQMTRVLRSVQLVPVSAARVARLLQPGNGAAPRARWRVRHGGAVAVNPSGGTLCTNPIAVTGLVRAIDAANQVMGTRRRDAGAERPQRGVHRRRRHRPSSSTVTVLGDEPRAPLNRTEPS